MPASGAPARSCLLCIYMPAIDRSRTNDCRYAYEKLAIVGREDISDAEIEVSFRWKNPDFLFKNPDWRSGILISY